MLYDVYDLGQDWQSADLVAVAAHKKTADVRIQRRFPASPHDKSLVLTLYAPGTREEIWRPLVHARLIAMSADSIMFDGEVYIPERDSRKAKVNRFTVTYLLKPEGAPVLIDAAKLVKRRADKMAMAKMMGNSYAADATYGPLDDSIV